MILNPRWNPKNKFCVLRLHYSADPEKNNPEWIAQAKRGTSERAWNREYEIDYDTFEGQPVFEGFKEDLHIKAFEYDPALGIRVLRGWDFGFHRPAVTIGWMNEHDQLMIRREILGHDEGIRDFATRVINISQQEFPNAKWVDACDPAGHQKTDKAELTSVEVLNSLGVYPTSKPSNISEKLEIIRQRLLMRNDGRVGMFVHPDCTRIINGFKGGYRYPEEKQGVTNELPLKDNYYDNCVSGDTLVKTSNGWVEIKNIVIGNMVLTRKGYKKVIDSWLTERMATVNKYYFSNGQSIIVTPGHPVYTKNKGFIPISNIKYYDIMRTCEISIGQNVSLNKLLLMATGLIDFLNLKTKLIQDTINAQPSGKIFMFIYGRKLIVKFLSVIKFIIETTIFLIINFLIWLSLKLETIRNSIGLSGKKIQHTWKKYSRMLLKLARPLLSGTRAKRVENGIRTMVREFGKTNYFIKRIAMFVIKNMKHISRRKQNIAQIIVTPNHYETGEKKLIFKTSSFKSDVYNLTIEDTPEYFANGILVHNCMDSLQYLATNFLTVAPVPGQTTNQVYDNPIMRGSNDIMGGGSSIIGQDFTQ